MTLDLSIVIPTYNEWPHIFYTAHSAMLDLEDGNISYEIIIVDNGSDEEEIKKIKPLCSHYPIKLMFYQPQAAILALREGIRKARGKTICCLNGHSLLSKDFFKKTFGILEKGDAEGVHVPVSYGWSWPLDRSHTKTYRYYLEPYCGDEKFGVGYVFNKLRDQPYPVAAQASHGFSFLKEAYEKIGEVNDGMIYCGGGSETYVDLKMWMFGFRLVLEPTVTALHFNSPRRYPPMPNYYARRNAFITYHTLGGEEYARRLLRTHVMRSLKNPGYASDQFDSSTDDPGDIEACYEDAAKLAEPERKFIEANAEIKFDELWDWFDNNNVYWRKEVR